MAIAECKIYECLFIAKKMMDDRNLYSAKHIAELAYEMCRAQINHPVKLVRPSAFLLEKAKDLCIKLGVTLWEDSPAAENERKCIARIAKRKAKAK